MYLIKVEVDRREAAPLLADCQKMHRFITALFGTDRKSSQLLYRTNLIRDRLNIYIYAQRPVQNLAGRYEILQREITSWLEAMEEGQTWSFDLIAAPSKKVAAEGRKNSQRRILRDPEERQEWLSRKAEQSGFAVLQVTEQEQLHVSGKHRPDNGGEMHHDAFHYQGILRITDAEAFRRAICSGIGPGKAYGFGMMMVKRI